MNRAIFTFDTTHHALWAEEVATSNGIAFETIPAPPEANARCSIALETLVEDVGRMRSALDEAAVSHALYRGR